MYIKLYYREDMSGVDAIVMPWHHEQVARDALIHDLSVGYNVLFITLDSDGILNFESFTEKPDERDERETFILFTEFEKYSSFNKA